MQPPRRCPPARAVEAARPGRAHLRRAEPGCGRGVHAVSARILALHELSRLGSVQPGRSLSAWRTTAACSPTTRCSASRCATRWSTPSGTVVPTVLISLAVAGVLNRKIKGIGIFRTIIFLPLAVSSVVMAVVWQFVFNTNNGLLNIMLGWVGIDPDPVAGRPEMGHGRRCASSAYGAACRSRRSSCWPPCKACRRTSMRRPDSTARGSCASSSSITVPLIRERRVVRGRHLDHPRVPGV